LSLKKQDLIKSLMRLGLTKNQAAKTVDVFFETLTAGLREERKVSIVGFGTWEWKKRPARVARNPKSGKKVVLGARKVLVFKPSPKFKKKMNS
jgi:nucleoid DNA-binding protein